MQNYSGSLTTTSAWNAVNCTATASGTLAPDGTTYFTTITSIASAGNRVQTVGGGNPVISSQTYTVSVYVKAGTSSFCGLVVANGASAGAIYNLTSGTVVSTAGATVVSASIIPIGSGVYRVSLTFTTTGTAVFMGVGVSDGSTYSFGIYPSASSGTILATFAQMEIGSVATPYNATPSVPYYGPRFDTDPATLQSKGLLIEEQRTNINLNSATGTTQTISVTSGQSYTISFYGTGSIVMAGAYTGTLTGTGAFPTRKTLTFTAATSSLVISSVTGTVQYVQVELGAFATSYIPTGVSQVTRNADLAKITGTDFTNLFNPNSGTLFVKYQNFQLIQAFISAFYKDGNNYIGFRQNTSSYQVLFRKSGQPLGDLSIIISPVLGQVYSFATSYDLLGGSRSFSLNGNLTSAATSASDYTNTYPALEIGNCFESNFANGWISKIAYYPIRLSDQWLYKLTV
jgi:hypothetical protein